MCKTCYLPLQHVDDVICLHAGLTSSQNCEFQTLANVGGGRERTMELYVQICLLLWELQLYREPVIKQNKSIVKMCLQLILEYNCEDWFGTM